MKRIFWILMIVVVVIIGLIWLGHRSKARALNSGEVVVRNQAAGNSAPQAPATPPAGQNSQPAAPAGDSAPAPPTADSALTPPSADSIRRSPPNGMVFAGSGKFQLYRQGDITWRVNTQTGDACILFASDAQWRNPQVYSHGCGPA
jgi:hypothetical protein